MPNQAHHYTLDFQIEPKSANLNFTCGVRTRERNVDFETPDLKTSPNINNNVCIILPSRAFWRNTHLLRVECHKLLRKFFNWSSFNRRWLQWKPSSPSVTGTQKPECERFGVFNTSVQASHPIMCWPRILCYFEVLPKASIWKLKRICWLSCGLGGGKKWWCRSFLFFFDKAPSGKHRQEIILEGEKKASRSAGRKVGQIMF